MDTIGKTMNTFIAMKENKETPIDVEEEHCRSKAKQSSVV
jgi:hypothetical protein